MPENAVYVGRPTRWGNPFDDPRTSPEERVRRYRQALLAGRLGFTVEDVRKELRGRDLACWCPLDRPCHADVLLEIANADGFRAWATPAGAAVVVEDAREEAGECPRRAC